MRRGSATTRARRSGTARESTARPTLLLIAAALVLANAVAPAAAATLPYPTKCVAGGPICGTDEGDDVFFTGETAAIQFFGENGHDTVSGSVHGDRIVGGGGNDELHGDRGDDAIDGGDDSDLLFGGPGDDTLRERRFGFDRLFGGAGNDTLAGGRANDRLYGGPGSDVLYGGSGSDRLYGGPGDDVLYGGPNRDAFDCGPGNDTVYRVRRDTGPSSLERHDSFIAKAAGCERIVDGDPTARFPLRGKVGSNGNDVLAGTADADLIEGKGGADKLDGGAGDDELEGDGGSNQGGDTLIGGAGDDRLAGRAGNDQLFGDGTTSGGPAGNDEIVGGAGRDTLVGGGGSDAIAGAYDGDRVIAGAGNDVVSLLGGDTRDPNGTAYVDCGPGVDLVVINPARRGTYRNCDYYADQWHEADWSPLLRPSPEVFPEGAEPARAAAWTHASADPPPPTEADPAGRAGPPSISDDGNRVAFSSDAPNLIDGDSNGERTDPFVRDIAAATTLAADSVRGGLATYGGRFRRGPSGAISADGRLAVFSSRSSDLGRSGSGYRVWVRDLQDGSTRLACKAPNAAAESPVISADGRRVAFETLATNLAGSDINQQVDIYWCDLASGELRRASTPAQDGVNTSGTSLDPSISADGRYVAWTTDARIFWKDMDTGEIRPVDESGAGAHPRISGDGQYVLFDSDVHGSLEVLRKNVVTGVVDQIAAGIAEAISNDGNVVAFSNAGAVFTRNFATGAVSRISPEATPSYGAALSGTGRYVAFASQGRIYRRDVFTNELVPVTVGVNLSPRSRLDAPLGKLPRRKARRIEGTTEDDGTVTRVEVSMSRRIGNGRCLWLVRGGRVRRGRCSKPTWLPTRLDNGLRFALTLRHLLPRGTWSLRTRAIDLSGRVERPETTRVRLV